MSHTEIKDSKVLQTIIDKFFMKYILFLAIATVWEAPDYIKRKKVRNPPRKIHLDPVVLISIIHHHLDIEERVVLVILIQVHLEKDYF
jgi:hypothetical protein